MYVGITVSCQRHFLPGTAAEPTVTPTPLTLQHSAVASTAVFGTQSTECVPGTASKFFFKSFVTIAVGLIIIGKSHI
jgi:hypothetical protein